MHAKHAFGQVVSIVCITRLLAFPGSRQSSGAMGPTFAHVIECNDLCGVGIQAIDSKN